MARVVFFGTPEFGVPVLEELVAHYEVVGVVTQPDRRAGRGRRRMQMPAVKVAALQHDLLVLQPRRLRRDEETILALEAIKADLFVIAAYGQILPRRVLDIPPHGCIGVHGSLLPKLRGAAPIPAAIMLGERETGITLMLTDAGMDTGAIIAKRSIPIASNDTTESLGGKLARLGAALLIETLPDWLAGGIDPTPQDDALATYAPPIPKAQGAIDWTQSAVQIDRQVRAFNPWPCAFCLCDERDFKIHRAHPVPEWRGEGCPGTVVETEGGIGVATGEGLLVLDEVQLAGKRPMDTRVFARGRPAFVCSLLVSCCEPL